MNYDYDARSFTVCNNVPVRFYYNVRKNGTVSDYCFVSPWTWKTYGEFVQRELRRLGEADRIIDVINNWR